MEQSLSSVFDKHLGFPGHGGARIGVEAFVARLVERNSGFEEASDDIVRWVDHFFETEEAFGERKVEFAAFAEGREQPVLQLELGDQEFVVLESDDEEDVIVVSNEGTMIVSRTTELASRLKAAELPAPQQYRPTDAFKPGGERVYRVDSSGVVSSLDAKAVMAALRAAPMVSEPVARVSNATSRLAAFSPSTEARSSAASTWPAASPPATRSFAAREVQELARKDHAATGPSAVKVIERSGVVRDATGMSARVWQHLAAQATDKGARAEGDAPGASAVALGQQTYAVKAGGITAIVQRPVQALASGGALATKLAERTEERAERSMPLWLRDLLTGASRGGFWIDPAREPVPAHANSHRENRPGWVSQVMEQARGARQRAQDEIAGDLDPAPRAERVRSAARISPARTVATEEVLAEAGGGRTQSLAKEPGTTGSARARGAVASIGDDFSPRYRVSARGVTEYKGPIGWAGALPATTLRALFTSLEHTATREGRQLRFADVELSPTTEFGKTQSERSVVAMPVARLDIDSVSMATPQLAGARTTIGSTGTDSIVVTQSRIAPQRLRPQGRIFSLPFEEGASLRIGPELDRAMARAFARPDALEPITVPATLETVVKVTGGPGRVRIEVPELKAARPRVRTQAMKPTHEPATLDLAADEPLAWTSRARPVRQPGARHATRRAGIFGAMPAVVPGFGLGMGAQAFQDSDGRPSFYETDTGEQNPEMFGEWASEADWARPRESSGLFARHEASGASAIGAMLPASRFLSSDEFGWGSGIRAPEESVWGEPALATSTLPLAGVNARRLPLEWSGEEPVGAELVQSAGGGYEGTRDEDALHFDIPMPLHAQMSAMSVPIYARRRADGPIGQPTASLMGTAGRSESSAWLSASPSRSTGVKNATGVPGRASFTQESAPQGTLVESASAESISSQSRSTQGQSSQSRSAQGQSAQGQSAHTQSAHGTSARSSAERGAIAASRNLSAADDDDGSRADRTARVAASSVQIDSASDAKVSPKSMPAIRRPRSNDLVSGPSQVLVTTPESAPETRTATSFDTSRTSSSGRRAQPSESRARSASVAELGQPNTGSSVASRFSESSPARLGEPGTPASLFQGPQTTFARSAPIVDQASSEFERAPARTKRRGATPLRFSFPTSARWWQGPAGVSGAKSGYAGHVAATGAVVAGPHAAVEGQPYTPRADARRADGPDALHSQARESSGASRGLATQSASLSSVSTERTVGGRKPSRLAARSSASDVFVQEPSRSREGQASLYRGGLSDNETAYVVLGSDGNAQVMGAQSAARVAQQRGRGAPVDMAVVAAVPPQAPSLEQMSVPGHDRPHAKSKKESPAAAGTPKSDAMSLHGTVDSLAQRIYHRLRRRLEADRERFGG